MEKETSGSAAAVTGTLGVLVKLGEKLTLSQTNVLFTGAGRIHCGTSLDQAQVLVLSGRHLLLPMSCRPRGLNAAGPHAVGVNLSTEPRMRHKTNYRSALEQEFNYLHSKRLNWQTNNYTMFNNE